MKKKICILLVLLLVVTTLGACNKTGTPTDNPKTSSTDENTTPDTTPIKVAVVGPLTGNYAEYGIGFKTASEIMVDKWNKDGGINGRLLSCLFMMKRAPLKKVWLLLSSSAVKTTSTALLVISLPLWL